MLYAASICVSLRENRGTYMIAWLRAPIMVGLSVAASSVAAQSVGAPAVVPGLPAPTNNMNPYAPPSGMEAHDSAIEPSVTDRLNTTVRDRAADSAARNARGTAAAAGDIVTGSEVRDSRGKIVGMVEAVESDGAVVAAAAGRVKVPLEAFGKNRKGLMLGITKAEFDAAVASAMAASAS